MAVRILVVNPNSSQSITDCISSILSEYGTSDLSINFFTGPEGAPPAINDDETSVQSTAACLPLLLESHALETYSAFLIACYSDHSLVDRLRKHTSKPVLGIMQASIVQALALAHRDDKFGIVTTGAQWEPLLTPAVLSFLGSSDIAQSRFAGVITTGLGVLDLHAADPQLVTERMSNASKILVDRGATVICLGCAGMAGMEQTIQNAVRGSGKKVWVVDGVKAGVSILADLVKVSSS
ncbi:hypothetical protein SISNIDRAFT_437020 [Sistotremastrum niveocremeum HHB9708]|uniref:Asp/Glu/hydantoin racemase n=1 Tax=Sistotremastrum niveocremeum HHB9708 TaxID=1314777 RepID=A0A164YMI4_9AGAM|nr:hypothetical protein SISNIDRAFT_437020 [Sistotremastrum niveocremeum HHB9708]